MICVGVVIKEGNVAIMSALPQVSGFVLIEFQPICSLLNGPGTDLGSSAQFFWTS